MLKYSQCKMDYKKNENETLKEIRNKIANELHISEDEIQNLRVEKKSVDARRKPNVFFQYTVVFSCEQEERVLNQNKKNRNLSVYKPEPGLEDFIQAHQGDNNGQTVIIGSGPAGLFCGYILALCGQKPIIVERGAPMWERANTVNRFWKNGVLDTETNVSFGEGGAGTFSDGKLNTGVKDHTGKKQFVLDTFVQHGAPEEIQILAKPHIGTDQLRDVIVSMRETIEELGGSYYFHTCFNGFTYEEGTETDQRRITGVSVTTQEGESKTIPCQRCVLAIGHSARDTFYRLLEEEVQMESKPFAVGVRVEHSQRMINQVQYGREDDRLPAADYKLTGKTSDGRGVYSFCMCPGGYVVNASTEQGMTVVNGMSNHARDSVNANSAIVVAVSQEDFGSDDVLAGVEFQRHLEKKTYEIGKGKIPVQTLEDFMKNETTQEFGAVKPCTRGEFVPANIKNILPTYISNGIMEGIEQFGAKLQGFNRKDTLILGTETRTSSPIRILRDASFESVNVSGVYPCGEGAGYAGGIMSAAMDGLRVALQIVSERN